MPKASSEILSPVDRQSEVLFGLIMAMTFTGTLSVAESGREEVRAMLVGAIGCNIAWGLVDGVMFIVSRLVDRAREMEAATGGRRAELTFDDLRGAAAVFLLVCLATIPVVLPFVFIPTATRALRVSNTVAVVMLFLGGWSVGRYAGLRPWRVATVMALLGVVLALATIALGG